VSAPVRTCLGCRRKAPQDQLLRFVAQNRELIADPTRRLPGRGAYTCRKAACFERAAARRAFARTLRRPVGLPDLNPFAGKD